MTAASVRIGRVGRIGIEQTEVRKILREMFPSVIAACTYCAAT